MIFEPATSGAAGAMLTVARALSVPLAAIISAEVKTVGSDWTEVVN
ncbi:MAG TPA: hypothetical protein PLX39_17530 [Pyrinomonadaceae bacterium]|nr:hypothetical protein [Pyrinomonadaceae bacterium]